MIQSNAFNRSQSEIIPVITIVFLFSVFPLLPKVWVFGTCIFSLLLTVLAGVRRNKIAFPLGVFCSVCLVLVSLGVSFSQIWFGIGLIVYIIVTRKTAFLGNNTHWLQMGRMGRDIYALAIGAAILAAISLITWFLVTQPNIKDIIDRFLPSVPIVYLILGGILFSIINAAVEEGAYRGVLMHALDTTLGAGKISLVIQAVSFGLMHINGFPRGWLGVILASIFGLIMGIIRRKSAGIFAPWMAHVLVDIVIVGIVAFVAHTT